MDSTPRALLGSWNRIKGFQLWVRIMTRKQQIWGPYLLLARTIMLHLDLLLPHQLLWEEEEGGGGEIKVIQMLGLLMPNHHLNSRPFWICCNGLSCLHLSQKMLKLQRNIGRAFCVDFPSHGCSEMGCNL